MNVLVFAKKKKKKRKAAWERLVWERATLEDKVLNPYFHGQTALAVGSVTPLPLSHRHCYYF